MTLRDAEQIAHGLIQGFIGPDHWVMDMPSFYGALVGASSCPPAGLERPRRSGEADAALKGALRPDKAFDNLEDCFPPDEFREPPV